MLESGVYEKGSIDILSLLREILSGQLPKDVGAICIFIGLARSIGVGDKSVEHVEMESYEEHANRVIGRICEEVESKYGVTMVRVYHFIGEFDISEPMVLAIAAGRRRDRTFPALQEAIQRYKREPALWKREVYIDGSSEWISHA